MFLMSILCVSRTRYTQDGNRESQREIFIKLFGKLYSTNGREENELKIYDQPGYGSSQQG
jgi:hypothetical protein